MSAIDLPSSPSNQKTDESATGMSPLQALEDFCAVIEATGEGSTATDWPQLHQAYLQAVGALTDAGWRAA